MQSQENTPSHLMTPIPQFHHVPDTSRIVASNDPTGDEIRYEQDKPKAEERVLVRVVARNTRGVTLPGGFVAETGINPPVYCYRSQLPQLQALVEPDEPDFEAAKREFEDFCCEEVARIASNKPAFKWMTTLAMAEQMEKVRARDNAALNAELEKFLAMTGNSPEAIFYRKKRRGLLPLLSCEVIDTLGMPEQRPEVARARMAGAINSPMLEMMQRTLDAMQKQNETLIAALADKNSNQDKKAK